MINSNTSPKQAMKTLMSLAESLSLEQLENMASAPTQSLSISALDDFQAALNHENPEIRRVAKLVISLQILSLYGVNNKFIEQIIDCENNKTAKVFLNDEYFPEPTPKLFQAFCDVLRLSQMKQFVSEYDFSDLPEMCQSELLKAINDSSITTLGFNCFDVSTMSLSLFKEFLSLIENHHFDELYFHLCNFYLLNPTQFQRFIQVLEFSKAKSLSLFDANYPGNNLPILCQLLTTENSSLIEFNTDIHSYWLNDLEYELWMSAIKNSKLRAMRLLPETADLMRFEIYCETIRNLEELDVSFDEWLNQLTPDQIKLFSDSTPNLRKLNIGSVDLFESNEQDKMIAWIDFFKKSKLIKIDFNCAELNGSEYDTEVLFDTLAELRLESLDVPRLQFNLTPSTFAAFCRLIKSISYKLTVTAEPVAESDKRFEGLCNAIADLQCRELDFEYKKFDDCERSLQIKFFDAVQNNIRLQKIHLPTLSMSDYQIVAAAINENIKFHEMSAKFLDLANQISDINEFYFTPEQVASEDTCILLKISLMLELLEIYSDIDTIRSRKLFQSLKATLSDILTNLFVHRKICIFGLEEYLAPNAELRGFYCIQAMAEALSTLDSTQNREACIAEVVVNSFDLLHDEKGAELVLNPECQTVLDCYLLEGAGIIARPGSFAMDERMRMELKNQLLFRYLANEGRIEIENSKKRSLIEGEFAPEKKAMLQHASESKKRSIFQSAVLPNNKKTTLEAETDTVTHSL